VQWLNGYLLLVLCGSAIQMCELTVQRLFAFIHCIWNIST